MSLVRIITIFFIVLVATMTSVTGASAKPTYDDAGCLDNDIVFEHGFGCWVYHDSGGNADKPVRVRYYYPPSYSSGTRKVLFAMHGSSRDAQEVIERWLPYADIYGALLIAPEFSRTHYPKGRNYNRGNVRDDRGRIRDERDWTFTTIEEIFDLVRQEVSNVPGFYSIQGHSGGGQFVHRLVIMLPHARVERAVASNAGWYLIPDERKKYPCGISNVSVDDDDLENSYAMQLVLTLGTNDVDPHSPGLSHRACAEEQGRHRHARGHFFYSNAQHDAQVRGHAFGWSVSDVVGASHDADSMVESGADVIFSGMPVLQGDVLLPTHDAVVKANYPNSNYGYRDKLQVDGNSVKTTYMQFNLQSVTTVDRAVLRLKISDPSDAIQNVREVTSNNWDEDTLTYNNRPAATSIITTINGAGSGSWISINISDYVKAKKGTVMSLALDSLGSDGLSFGSKESSGAQPELVIHN